MKAISDKQRAFILKLTPERDYPVTGATTQEANIIARHEDVLGEVNAVSMHEASAVIDWLLRQPKKNTAPQIKLEPGVYVLGEGIIKLQDNKAKTNAYTMIWVETTSAHLNENGERVKGEWQYDPELKKYLKPEHRMTLEQAKAFMLRYGQCAKCARKLKAAQSVEDGIGPVCKKYFSVAA